MAKERLFLILLMILIVVMAGVGYRISGQKHNSEVLNSSTESIEKDLTPEPTSTQSPTSDVIPPTPTPQPLSEFSTSPLPHSSPSPSSISLANFIYPNSQLIQSSSSSIILESNDNSQTITEWYKDKIRSLGFNAKSFITTNANGKILNKLAASNGEAEIMVEIEKEPQSQIVKISVNLKIS